MHPHAHHPRATPRPGSRRRWPSRARSGVLAVAALVGVLVTSRLVSGADFACAAGDVACLIAAITTANANGEANTITLAAGIYTLTAVDNTTDGPNGLPSVTSTLTLTGGGAERTIIERAASAPAFRLVHVAATGALTLEGLTLRGGGNTLFSNLSGGGLLNNGGQVTLSDSRLASNTVVHGYGGGLVSTQGTVILRSSTLAGNTGGGTFGVLGGGLTMLGGTLTITDSTIAGNVASGPTSNGGGVYASEALVEIVHSTLADNRVNGHIFSAGGGLAMLGGTLTITNSTIAGNSVGAQAPSGGGLAIGTLTQGTITNSTIAGNVAGGGAGSGGGISNSGALTITNSTLTNNSAGSLFGGHGGGISNSGALTITNSTLANNSASGMPGSLFGGHGGGLSSGGVGSSVALQNTILALNTATAGTDPDCMGPITSLGNNLIGDPTGCTLTLQPSDLTGDPGFDAFTDDGTPGNGHFPLLPTSPAIGAGNAAACPPTDQLGQPRGGRCDIGAIEFQPTNRCPLGQDFWKHHTGVWPVMALTLGSQTYTQAALLALFDTPPRGDASLILAHQLIAAKLNIANGSTSTPISATIRDADRLLRGFTGMLPYHVQPSSATGQAMVNDADVLDSYNSGDLTPDCQP